MHDSSSVNVSILEFLQRQFLIFSPHFLLQALNKDIQEHQQPILEVVQDVESFLKQYGNRVDQSNQSRLRNLQTELKTRYGVVNYQSTNRQTKVRNLVRKVYNL